MSFLYLITVALTVKKVKESEVAQSANLWTVGWQACPPKRFSKQEYWSRLSFPSPGDLTNPGSEPGSPALQADPLPSELPGQDNVK